MTNSPSLPRTTIGFLLRNAYDHLNKQLYSQLDEAGFPDIRPSHSAVFRSIQVGGSRASWLAEKAGMTKQSMAYLIDSLQKLGYVTSQTDPADRRAQLVKLTTKGESAMQTLMSLSMKIESEWAQQFGESEFAHMREHLEYLNLMLESATTKVN